MHGRVVSLGDIFNRFDDIFNRVDKTFKLANKIFKEKRAMETKEYDHTVRSGIVVITAREGRGIMKPCPFCGSPAEMCETIMGFYCRCTNHECETMQTECDERPEALEAWNRRRSSHEDYHACVRKILKFDEMRRANDGK